MSDQISSDEAFARSLFEKEKKELESIYQTDLELAKQLQDDALHELTLAQSSSSKKQQTFIDLTQEIDKEDKLALFELDWDADLDLVKGKKADRRIQKDWNDDLVLAKQLDREWNDSKQLQSDFLLAKQLEASDKQKYEPANELNNETDILNDTIPDLHALFLLFNNKYFNGRLSSVEVKWSTRMTRCAGTCTFRVGGHCLITMSEPLLKFRPKSDMINTLLHEMIHALLFLTQRNTDRDGHGPEFLKEAKRINASANSNITVYHDFHDEVGHYLTHVWKCNGVCQNRPPYFGIVKRSMNRPPQPADNWYAEHQRTCGGTYTKIASPPKKEKRKKPQSNDLQNYFPSQKKQKN